MPKSIFAETVMAKIFKIGIFQQDSLVLIYFQGREVVKVNDHYLKRKGQ